MEKTDCFFFGLETHWFTRDRLYMVFVTREALCGAYVAGQVYDETVARLILQGIYPFLRGWVRRVLEQRASREQQYKSIDPLSGEFLNKDRRNFCLLGQQILDVVVKRKRSLLVAYSVGTVRLTLASGETKKLVLLAGQDPDRVAEMLRRLYPATRLEGEASPQSDPAAKQWSHARRMRFYLLFCALFLFSAVGLAFTAVRRGHDPGQWAVAVLNLLGAIYCGTRAAKCRKSAADEKKETGYDSLQRFD